MDSITAPLPVKARGLVRSITTDPSRDRQRESRMRQRKMYEKHHSNVK